MSRVGQKNTRPELAVRSALHRAGYRYRLHDRRLPGSPDLVFPGRDAVVFVHGCFWHRHPGCRRASTPATRAEFWLNKFEKNLARDEAAVRELTAGGWAVHTIWSCEIAKNAFWPALEAFLNEHPQLGGGPGRSRRR